MRKCHSPPHLTPAADTLIVTTACRAAGAGELVVQRQESGVLMVWGLVAALLVILALGVPAAPQDKAAFVWKPNVISTQIGGAFGQSYEVTFDRRELRYYSAKNMFELSETKAVVMRPTDKQWEAFFDELDRLDVWSWKGRYDNPGVADGTSWTCRHRVPDAEAPGAGVVRQQCVPGELQGLPQRRPEADRRPRVP